LLVRIRAVRTHKMALDKNNAVFIINNEVRSLIRKELKIRPGGGER